MTILETVSSEPAAEPFTKSDRHLAAGEVKPAIDVGVLYRLYYLLQRTQRHGGPSFRSGDAVLVSCRSVDDFIHQPHPTANRPLPVRWWPPPRGLRLFPAHLLIHHLCIRPVATSLIGTLPPSYCAGVLPLPPLLFQYYLFQTKTVFTTSLISPLSTVLCLVYIFLQLHLTCTVSMSFPHSHTGQMHVFPLFAMFLLHTCLALP